jgi:uncharacterized membrane protein
MSLVALIAGLPFPIINLIATVIFFFAHKKSTYFVRWHCLQALFSQLSLVIVNASAWSWTISILFGNNSFTDSYFAYLITILIYNIIELVATIYSAIQVKKGVHVRWWFFGNFTDLICKK